MSLISLMEHQKDVSSTQERYERKAGYSVIVYIVTNLEKCLKKLFEQKNIAHHFGITRGFWQWKQLSSHYQVTKQNDAFIQILITVCQFGEKFKFSFKMTFYQDFSVLLANILCISSLINIREER
uniref:Uncharacterized protein n=1 Tax=Glossina palpalis gambiensis TaxID=67801 RepID=A0A1B0B933_9MUSC